MSEIPITSHTIAISIAKYLFHYSKYVIVPNTNSFLPWEADILMLTPNCFLDEIEIKISLSDLRRDKTKHKHKLLENDKCIYLLRNFYYALPESIYNRASLDDFPEKAGIIIISDTHMPRIIKNPTPRKHARKLTDKEKFKLARLGVIRMWGKAQISRKEKNLVR
jgi:hypothetical protein